MKALLHRGLDTLLLALGSLIGLMIVTGGTRFEFSWGKLEFSSIDIWGIAFLLLLAWRGKDAPIWKKLEAGLGKILQATSLKPVLVWVAGLGTLLFLAHCLRHWSMGTHSNDLSFLHQPLFWAFGERPLHCDLCIGGTYFGEHIAFSLYLLAPLTSLFKSDELLFLIQMVLVTLPVLLLIVKTPTKKNLWLYLGIVLLCHRALRDNLVWDFREDHLAFFFLCLSCFALIKKHLALYVVTLLLALVSKENIGLVTLFLVAPILWDPHLKTERNHRYALAFITTIASLGWTILAFKYWIPQFSIGLEEENNIVRRFPGLGSSTSEVLINLLTSPSVWWELFQEKILAKTALKYLFLLFIPYAYFLRKKPVWIIPALPGLMMNLLSNTDTQRSLQFHYELIILPFLITGVLLSVQNQKWTKRELMIGLLIALTFSGRWPGWQIQQNWPSKNEWEATRFLRSIPNQGVVAAAPRPIAQLSHIRDLRQLALPTGDPKGLPKSEIIQRVWQANLRDRTSLKKHDLDQVTTFVLDRHDPWQSVLEPALLKNGFQKTEQTGNGRFVLLSQ